MRGSRGSWIVGRRGFGAALVGGLAATWRSASADPGAAPVGGGLTDVDGVKVGHFTETRRPTGCTVILAEAGAVCGVDVRGGAPGTRETDLLDPINTVEKVHAVVLAGGSAFGLDTATGVMRFLEQRGIGYRVKEARVPIVPAAILFDLDLGDGRIRPDAAAGYAAAQAATGGPVAEGNVGAGAGAMVGRLFGYGRAMKCGLGTASVRLRGGIVVAALMAVNAVGDVIDPATGRIVAGARTSDGSRFEGTLEAILEGRFPGEPRRGTSTTIGVVATNALLDKSQATKVAEAAHDGLARTINPVHTPVDGDTIFALSTGAIEVPSAALIVGVLAAEVTARAVLRAAWAAKGLPGLPSASEFRPL